MRLLATTALVVAATGTGAIPTAHATDVTNCNQVVNAGQACPGLNGGTRHTYNDNRTSWSTSVNYSCGWYIGQGMQRDSNQWGAPKYAIQGYCYLNQSFPNNTELLRGWGQNLTSLPWWLVNKSAY